MNIYNILPNELRHIMWSQLGVRPPLGSSAEDLHKVLHYEMAPSELGVSHVNSYRNTLMSFIAKYSDQLSLPCDGNCFAHSDGLVISCYQQLLEDTDGNTTVD